MSEELVDRLARVSVSSVWLEAEGVQGWFAVENEPEIRTPEKHRRGWDEGELRVLIRIAEEIRDEHGLVYPYGRVRAKTEEGEWQEPFVTLPERWKSGVDSEQDAEMPSEAWRGDRRDIGEMHVLTSEGWRMREGALEATEKVRSKAVERVVLVDAYVRYARETGVSGVWGEYVEEVTESSLTGFLDWLGEDEVERLLAEAVEMFPEREGVLDASGRTGWDAVFALQHFRRE
ncbi:hypothetical protein [Halopenitus persicus]|uniref:hypothetical protein n=1 Tax=Halopenitus persicus TaxID=1048396 RepID=UPI000BBB0CED|nr:hypothetical protein [Halopenitus persicus]